MHGVWAVWQRNFLFLRKSILLTFFWAAFEPILYLFAIGFSLGRSIGSFDGVRYVDFYVPALLTMTAMMVGYFEGTFGSFTKLVYQKTYATIFLTPVSAQEIVIGEILWCACKGLLGFICVGIVAIAFGALPMNNILLATAVLFLTSFLFSSLGMLMASIANKYDSFTYSISGFIVPMSLFSGTYFPLSDLPGWIQNIAYTLPLTHCVQLVRSLLLGREIPHLTFNLSYILTMTLGATVLAVKRVTNKLEN
jgi:lipooligosaccharide transport system permease protein